MCRCIIGELRHVLELEHATNGDVAHAISYRCYSSYSRVAAGRFERDGESRELNVHDELAN